MMRRRGLLLALAPAIIAPGVLMPISTKALPRIIPIGQHYPVDPIFNFGLRQQVSVLTPLSLLAVAGDILEYRNPNLPGTGGRWLLSRSLGVTMFGYRRFEAVYLGVSRAV